MAAKLERRRCPGCGLATAREERGFVLCGACGSVTRTAGPPAARSTEPWALELEIGEYRAALDAPVFSRRTIVLRGAAVVLTVVAAIVVGLVGAFLMHGGVNVRYVGTLAALLTFVGAFVVAAVAWAAGDPSSPLRDVHRRRLEAAERALGRARDDDDTSDGL